MSLEGSGLFKLRGRAGSAGLIAKHGVKSAANRGFVRNPQLERYMFADGDVDLF